MTTTRNNLERLSSDLLQLVHSDAPLPCACIRVLKAQLVRNYTLEGGLIAIPLRGRSRIHDGHSTVEVSVGEMLIVPNARAIDWEQFPDDAAGDYIAIGIQLDQALIGSAQQVLPESLMPPAGSVATEPLDLFLEPLAKWVAVMRQGNKALALHAVVEMIIRLYQRGHSGLLRIPPPSLAMQIRRMVTGNPSHSWQSAHFEAQLLLSGPTLRRRLAQEGTNLRKIVADARMAHGLHVLLTTTLPVKTVAAQCGYDSASSFARRFAERYGVEPANVGRR